MRRRCARGVFVDEGEDKRVFGVLSNFEMGDMLRKWRGRLFWSQFDVSLAVIPDDE